MNYNQYPQNSAKFTLDYINEEIGESGGIRASQEPRRQGNGPPFISPGLTDKND